MTTKTILKDDGIYIYEDYKLGRAALRIKELTAANPVQNIRRHSNLFDPVKAVLISADYYDALLATFATGGTPTYKQIFHTVSDDYMGSNLSKMIDYLQGHPQTKSLVKAVVEEGLTSGGFVTYKIIASAEWYEDQSPVIPFEESAKKAGQVIAYLLHPVLYQFLTGTPVATIYVGVGNGTLEAYLLPGGAITETITITALNPTNFAVVGSVTGAMGTAVVDNVFTTAQVEILISNGSIPFVAGDMWTIDSVAVVL